MWWLFQVLIMTLIIGSNGAYHWAPKYGGFAVVLLAAFAASLLSVWLNDLLLWVRRKRGWCRTRAFVLALQVLPMRLAPVSERAISWRTKTMLVRVASIDRSMNSSRFSKLGLRRMSTISSLARKRRRDYALAQMTGALFDDETTDFAHTSSTFGTRRTPLYRNQRHDAEQRRRHQVIGRRQRIAGLRDPPGRHKRGEAAEDRHRDAKGEGDADRAGRDRKLLAEHGRQHAAVAPFDQIEEADCEHRSRQRGIGVHQPEARVGGQ